MLGAAAATIGHGDSAPEQQSERARPAAAFTDSVGINVHLSYRDTSYGDTRRVETLLEQLGVRHLRDGMTLGNEDACRSDRALAASGFRFTYITQTNPTPAQLTSWASCVGPAIEAFEGLNEYDISHPPSDTDWAATVRSSQQALYRSVKGSRELAGLTVVGPSLTSDAAFRAVGDLSPNLDDGNIHDYFSNHEPETGGWGLGGYGSIAYNIRVARAVDPTKPIESTETGYGTDRAERTVDDVAQATYLPRLLLEQFATGIPRTFNYELLDEGGAPFNHYGIVDGNLRPKPAYTALASLIAVLHDTGDPVSTGTLRYSIDGAGDVHHVLLQKRDGRYALALWLPASTYDPATRTTRDVAPEAITLQIATPFKSAAAYAYGSDWNLHRTALPATGPLHLMIGDRVTIVELVPAGA
jgi:hypothetical protein